MDNDPTGGMGELADQTEMKVNQMLSDRELQIIKEYWRKYGINFVLKSRMKNLLIS